MARICTIRRLLSAICLLPLYFRPLAGVAQLVEQRIRNARVGSSNLFSGTIVRRKRRAPARRLFVLAVQLTWSRPHRTKSQRRLTPARMLMYRAAVLLALR